MILLAALISKLTRIMEIFQIKVILMLHGKVLTTASHVKKIGFSWLMENFGKRNSEVRLSVASHVNNDNNNDISENISGFLYCLIIWIIYSQITVNCIQYS